MICSRQVTTNQLFVQRQLINKTVEIWKYLLGQYPSSKLVLKSSQLVSYYQF